MGLQTFLYGFIAEPASLNEADNASIIAHNSATLAALPEVDEFPPLHRTALYVNHHSNWNGIVGNYRGRTISISGRYKQMEDDIGEWLVKFEALLNQLFWEEATIHLKTEWYGDFVFEWVAETSSDFSQPFSIKNFNGPFRNWNDFVR